MKILKNIFTSSKKPLAAMLFGFVGLFSIANNACADAAISEEQLKKIGHVAKRFKHRVPYDGGMVLIHKHEKRLGRKVLKDPDNQKEVCVAYHRDKDVLRFGYVDGSVCRIGSWGSTEVSMDTDEAHYVHFPEGGEWIDLNHIKEEDEQALIGNHPGHPHSKASLAYIPEHQAIGGRFFSHGRNVHYGIPGHEKHVPGNQARQKGVKVFIPKASQNPFHEFDLHQDMRLIEQGKEKGVDIVKSPNGNKIACIGHHVDKRVVRFGWADGNVCRIGSWGHQAIPFAKNDHSYRGRAYYFTFKNGGRWVKNAHEAEKMGDGEHPLIATAANTLDKHHTHSWAGLAYDESRDVTGGYYFGYGDRLPHFLDPRSMKEVSNRNYAQIHVYVPNIKVNAMHQIFHSPYMQLMKKGQENGRAVLKSPDGLREVCVGVHRRGPHNMRFGWVDGSVCRIGSWGAQAIPLDGKDGYLVHFPFSGQWVKPGNIFQYATPQLVDPLLGAHGGINGPNHDSCAGLIYHESKQAVGGNYFGWVDSNKSHNANFVSSKNMREENEKNGNAFFQFIPYRMPIEQMFKVDDRIKLIPYGKHKGKEGELLKDPSGKNVCATIIELDPFNIRHTEKIISTGFEKDGICYNEAWGPRTTPMTNGVYYVKSKTGSKVWKSFKDFGNDAVKANIFHKNEFSLFTNAISAKGDVVGRSHPPGIGITAINANKGVINSGTPDDILLFDPDGKEALSALDVSQLQSHAKVEFVKYGEHSGKEADLLKDPSGNYVCMMYKQDQKQVYFGHEKDGKCHGEAWGPQHLPMDGLHYVKAKGSWKKRSELSDAEYKASELVKKGGSLSNWSTGVASLDGYAGKTHPHTHNHMWGIDKNMKMYAGVPLTDARVRVFVPGEGQAPAGSNLSSKPAEAAASSDKPALDVSQLQSHAKVEFVKYGEHSGKEADLLKDPSGNYVCMMYKQDQKQVYFGHEKDGKCHGEAWGPQHLPMDGLHYVKAKGSWKKHSELSGNQFAETTIVKKDGTVSNWVSGIGSRDGYAGKTHPTDEKLWGVDKNGNVYGGFSLRDNTAHVFVPGEEKPKAEETRSVPAESDSSTSSDLPSDFDGLVYISMHTDLQKASSGISGDAEKKKWGEKHYIDFGKKEGREYKKSVEAKEDTTSSYDSAPTTPSDSAETEPANEEKKDSGSVLDTKAIPDLAGQEVLTMTTEQIVSEIDQGKMIASDPDSAVLLEQQPAVDLLGEPYSWVRLGRGFATDPVELSPHNGVICRFLEQGKMYIGNLYKNKFESPQAKVGDIICRAATNLDNLVYLTKNFETLSAREGALPLWQPMIVVQPENWETGYRTINVGQTVTENDKTFKVYGVCRTQKEKNPAHYHIGRAEVDEAGKKHCFMKKGGKQQDWTGDDLNQVEVLARGAVGQQKIVVSQVSAVAPQSVR